MKREYLPLWERCVAFHGHACGGLAIGLRASLYAMKLLDMERAQDEEVVCVTENDACGVDAVQVILGCTAGKGNLIFNLRGKNAFTFYRRRDGKAVRLVLRPVPGQSKEEKMNWLLDSDDRDIFDVKEPPAPLPEKARIFRNYTCAVCGETVAESHVHLQNGETVCDACYSAYTRGL